MNQQFSLPTALCLPVPDIEALIQGRTVAALPRMFLRPGQRFALYPVDVSANQLSIEKYYRSNFLPNAQTAIKQVNSKTVSIKAWAKCELCQILDKSKPLDILSQLTIWTPEVFEAIIQKQQNIFLAYLRVYHLPQFCEVPVSANIQDKLGKFVGLPNIAAFEAKPILDDQIFSQRKHQLEKLEPPQNRELEELQSALSQIANTNLAAQQLENDIKIFLGWSSEQTANRLDSDLDWIKTIETLGDRSIELEEKKSTYQAGTDFENIARKSLNFLGFKVETAYKGGAGGLDLFCSKPYPIVCECKAGRLIPSGTVEELIKLGGMHLGSELFFNSVKLIIGPGKPSPDTQKAAQQWKVSIINAMTLQKLVELKAKYPGAINLVELQKYLQPGQIDHKIDEYIDKVEIQIKLRSHIIQVLKNYLELAKRERAGVEALHATYLTSHPPQPLNSIELREILIELSSPLTGYVGRIKGEDWRRDRFYYLRDLPIN
ncbi:protein of unknown function (DUF1802) [Cylindrospermum stagnale PCC 7417]|uniref:DUF1802 domain-containing protein n=1 Tax=Cylindrospermum stagnale PCC 7417 TaxID=56107 RepID=K9X2Y2_9NOST|nr:DUF1802 family protein [Cylindrospermum stagnale]AFZ27000.1 protein of unknown function (DUF1802) [Cylindrospermum stagnale PCC 7417]